MRFVVGLGNPGPKYAETRHNFGFLCLEELSRLYRADPGFALVEENARPQVAQWEHWRATDNSEIALLWPLTYMNLCAAAITFLSARLGTPERHELLVVVDDMSLPLGQLRLRARGSSGGHNGLKSIEGLLGDGNYSRLRMGIGQPPTGTEVTDFVLSPFEPREREAALGTIAFAASAVADWNKGVSFDMLVGKVNGWRFATPSAPTS